VGLRRGAGVESVIVEEPFSLLPPSSSVNQSTYIDNEEASSSASHNKKDAPISNSNNHKAAGEGCFVSATVQNKRYYGVLIDQASLKAASHLWFEDEASSLDLNRRMKILKSQQQQQQQTVPQLKEQQQSNPTTTSPFSTIQDEISALLGGPSGSIGSTSATSTSVPTEAKDTSTGGNLSLNPAGLKRPPPNTSPLSASGDAADTRRDPLSEFDNGSRHKRTKLDGNDVDAEAVSAAATTITETETADTATATTVNVPPESSAVPPTPPLPSQLDEIAFITAPTTMPATSSPPPSSTATMTPATSLEPPPSFSMSQPHRQVQKFRFVEQSNQPPVLVSPSGTGGRRRGGGDAVVMMKDPDYRDLLATYANVMAAASDDPTLAEKIQQACDQGGNFVPRGSCGGGVVVAEDYYYQYEVLSTTLTAQHGAKHTLESGLRTSLGLHTFLHNTILPPWFPLSNLQLGPQKKVLTMLNMKRDNNGNVVYDHSKDLLLHHGSTLETTDTTTITPMGVMSSSSTPFADVALNRSGACNAIAMRLLATSGTHVPMQPRPKPRYQIGVIGGGIAGLACCRELIRQLEQDGIDGQVTLLEARSRLGGRLWTDTTTFTRETTSSTAPKATNGADTVDKDMFAKSNDPLSNDSSTPGTAPTTSSSPVSSTSFPVDLGASWIHGIDHNPLAALAKEAGMDFVTTSEQVQMLGANLQHVDATVDEKMGKLFDKLLDLAADECWGAPEGSPALTTPSTTTTSSPEPANGTTALTSDQSTVRWYASVFVDDENDAKSKQNTEMEKKAGMELDTATATTTSIENPLKPEASKSGTSSGRQRQRRPLQATGVPRHRQSADRSIDFEVGKAIAKHKLREFSKLGTEEHRMLLWNTKNVEYALGANISDLSMKYWDSDERHAFEGDHVLLKQGYSVVVQYMTGKLEEAGTERFQLVMDFPVGKVEYARKSTTLLHLPIISPGGAGGLTSSLGRRLDSRELVEMSDTCSITSQDGSQTKYFDFLVCAVPLGVLKESVSRASSETIMFQPCLPFSKIDSIANVGFGLLDKVYLQFPKAFWRIPSVFQENDQSLFGNASGLNPHHYMFLDVGKSLTTSDSSNVSDSETGAGDAEEGPPILMSLVSGKEAIACECLSDEELVEEVMTTLRAIFISETITAIPEPSAFRITRWGQDRFSRGSYTFLPPGATDQDFQLLQSPINGNGDSLLLEGSEVMRLYFAGEHTTALHPSMAHGAMLSGIRAAKEIMSTIKFSSIGTSRDDKDVDRMIPVAMFRYMNPDMPLQCSFCQKLGGQVREGTLLAFKRGSRQALVHNNCAEYSPEVEVLDGKWKNVIKAVNRGKFLNCALCGKSGATMGCTTENCNRVFHFSCAEDSGYRFDRDGKVFYCDLHRRPPAKPPAPHECDRISLQYYMTKHQVSDLRCSFCGLDELNESTDGKFLAFQQLQQSNQSVRLRQTCVHEKCAKYTNIVDTTELEESRMGHEHRGIFLALERSKICVKCAARGATVRCSDQKCDAFFHVPCAQRIGWHFEKRGGSHFKCEIHRHVKSLPEPTKGSWASQSSTGQPLVGGLFQHNLLSRFGATAAGGSQRVDMPSNLDMGGTLMPSSSPFKDGKTSNSETDSSDSEESFPSQDGLVSEVMDLPLSIDIPGSKRLVRVDRPSRDDAWKLALTVVPFEARTRSLADTKMIVSRTGKRVKGVLVVGGSTPDKDGLQPGDTIVSMNGSKIGNDDLKTLRLVLLRLKQEVDLMIEVIRAST
jgi:[histone H3]-N6,N6-dimethyl-L-lysine4 FAD-dependent demethylase